MSNTDQGATALPPGEPPRDPFDAGAGLLFSYRGRISRKQYWIGLAVCIALLFVGLIFAAAVMNPTGGGAPFLALPVLGVFFWVHSAITIKRFRDAGWSPWFYLIFGIGPFVWLALTLELIEYIGPIIAIGFFGLLAVPGFLQRKTAEAAAPDTAPTTS